MSLANATFQSMDRATVSAAVSNRSKGGLSDRSQQLIGLAFVAIFSALFWSAAVAVTASLFGYQVGLLALSIIGASIIAFLSAVCAPVMLKARA